MRLGVPARGDWSRFSARPSVGDATERTRQGYRPRRRTTQSAAPRRATSAAISPKPGPPESVGVEDGSSGQTTANGTYTLAVPDTDELSVTVSTDQYETTLEREFGDTKERGESDRSDDHPGGGNGKDE